jgi:YesN/AraC family two-component response regulator
MLHKVLFVDDEASIRMTLPHILRLKGYEVTATGTVGEALAAMQKDRFDVLIADLNIGQPGDGFTVVSAMRRVQPDAVTLILTGYPAFESALEAIRSQVDDYLVKPADVEVLCSVIEKNLEQHTPIAHITPRKLWLVLREHKLNILGRWRQEIANPEATAAEAAEEQERTHYIGTLLDEIAERLEAHPSPLSRDGLKAAIAHGEYRAENGATLAELLCEIRIFRQVLFRLIEQNLLAVNTSYVIHDMTIISDVLDQQLQASVEAYQRSAEKAA